MEYGDICEHLRAVELRESHWKTGGMGYSSWERVVQVWGFVGMKKMSTAQLILCGVFVTLMFITGVFLSQCFFRLSLFRILFSTGEIKGYL